QEGNVHMQYPIQVTNATSSVKSSGRRCFLRRGFYLIALALAGFALSLGAKAGCPPPDEGYPVGNPAAREEALFGLTTGYCRMAKSLPGGRSSLLPPRQSTTTMATRTCSSASAARRGSVSTTCSATTVGSSPTCRRPPRSAGPRTHTAIGSQPRPARARG